MVVEQKLVANRLKPDILIMAGFTIHYVIAG